jgi:hypothetical protein
MADKLTKEAAEDDAQNTVYNRMPISTVYTDQKKKGLEQWQRQWESTEKGAMCRSFFPKIDQRLKLKIPITPEFTAIVTGHGKTKSYLHRFKITDNPMCCCNEGEQTSEHLIYTCKILENQRKIMIQQITANGGNWPTTNRNLIAKHMTIFLRFVKSIDFNALQ